MKKELWLEFGYKMPHDYQDMLWYNEGNANEFGYFLRNYFKFLSDKQPMYFLIRYGQTKLYLRNDTAKEVVKNKS